MNSNKYLILGALMLSGCATTSGGLPSSNTEIVTQVQQIASQTCKFLPTADTIIKIAGLAVPGLTLAESIATAICAAVAPVGVAGPKVMLLSKGSNAHTVHGITVHGRYLK